MFPRPSTILQPASNLSQEYEELDEDVVESIEKTIQDYPEARALRNSVSAKLESFSKQHCTEEEKDRDHKNNTFTKIKTNIQCQRRGNNIHCSKLSESSHYFFVAQTKTYNFYPLKKEEIIYSELINDTRTAIKINYTRNNFYYTGQGVSDGKKEEKAEFILALPRNAK